MRVGKVWRSCEGREGVGIMWPGEGRRRSCEGREGVGIM